MVSKGTSDPTGTRELAELRFPVVASLIYLPNNQGGAFAR